MVHDSRRTLLHASSRAPLQGTVDCRRAGAVSRRAILADDARAEMFQGMGRALGAGLDAARALDALAGIRDGALDPRLARAANAVRKGGALTATLERNGLIAGADRVLLAAAEDTGNLDRVCLRLADRYARAWVRWRQMRGRMLLPGAVLVIAVLVLPLPALASGSLSAAGYVLRTVALLALVAASAMLVSGMLRLWRADGTPGWLTRLARALPVTATMSRLHQRADACERLALALACGLPARDALDGLRRAERNPVRRRALVRASGELGGGAGVAGALQAAGLLDAPGYAIVSAGEGAGRLEDCLQRVAESAHDALDDRYDLLARWIPVLVYALAAAGVTVGILG